MQWIETYGLFLAETLTVVVAIGLVLIMISAIKMKNKLRASGELVVTEMNEEFDGVQQECEALVLDKKERKARKKSHKQVLKKQKDQPKKRVYLIKFDGDLAASGVTQLREEVSAVLSVANKEHDEVLVCVESPGGMVHGYGLAASQLSRIRDRGISLTVSVDKVAASGGYMMACVANKIIAAPFAVLGSIGVVAQMPNFHRLLDKHGIDFEQQTAGQYKRTLTMFGKNTDEDRAKFQEDIEDIHQLFKSFVAQNRPQVDIDQVATGEHWYGTRALEHQLVDELLTSDDYLALAHQSGKKLFRFEKRVKPGLVQKLMHSAQSAVTSRMS